MGNLNGMSSNSPSALLEQNFFEEWDENERLNPLARESKSHSDRSSLSQLSFSNRLVLVERVRVYHRRWHEITQEIERCHAMKYDAAEPQCLLIVGPTGAGKTTLINSYAERFQSFFTSAGTIRPILKATIPTPASEKNLAAALLYALGDPFAQKGSTGNMTQRVIRLLQDCKVELLILDELQHFVDRDSQKVLQNASNWLKMVIKEARVSTILVGLEGEAERVVNVNPQLARLFGDPMILSPFSWVEAKPQTIKEFRTCLYDLEKMLPLMESSHLYSREMAWRCFVASGGIMSYLMALVRRATQLALSQGKEYLDLDLMAEAFEQRLAGSRRGILNPFLGEPPTAFPSSNSIGPAKTSEAPPS